MYNILGADQNEYGPVPLEQIRQWIIEGRVDRATMVKPQGQLSWAPLASIPELAVLLPASPTSGPTLPGVPPSQQPAYASALPYKPDVPNYLVPAILATICCCPPFGVVAIVYAAQVNGKLQAGDLLGAQAASRNARMWMWIALAVGILVNAISLLLTFGNVFQLPR